MSSYTGNYDNSYALIAAIDEYHYLDTLNNAVRGANALEDLLRTDLGFTTELLCDEQATRENIIGWFSSLNPSPNDRVLFYFAGHGLTRQLAERQIGYLALSYLNPHKPETYVTSLKMDDLVEEADGLSAKHVLLILDACFGGYVFRRNRAHDASFLINSEADVQKYIQNLVERPVRYAISAGGEELVDDNASPDRNYSIFTYFLLEGLRSGAAEVDGLIRAKNLGAYLEKRVGSSPIVYHKPDHGYIGKGGDGDFVLRFPSFSSHKDPQGKFATVVDSEHHILDQHDISILQKLTRSAEVTVLKEITIGQSGSHVYLVDIKGRSTHDSDGLHFCKIYRTPSGEETKIYEAVSKTTIGEYIPKLVDSTPLISGWMASVYAVAHHTTLSESQPLSQIIHKNMLAATEGLNSLIQLLEKWNPMPFTRQNSHPRTLMLLPIERHKNASGVDLDIVERIGGLSVELINSEISTIQFDKKVLVNPLAYLLRNELWQETRSILWPSGHVHGDLHSNNIIYLIEPQQETVSGYPVIIDFDTYQGNRPVLFDLAYLELDLCMRMLPPDTNSSRELWLRVSEYLTHSIELPVVPPLEAQYYPLHSLLSIIRRTVSRICNQQRGDFEAAFWIARTSAGLSFARKRKINSAERKLMLLLAAHSLEKTLKKMGIKDKDNKQPIWIEWLDNNELTGTLSIEQNPQSDSF